MKKIYFLASVITLFGVNESSAKWCMGRGPSECKTEHGRNQYINHECYNQAKCLEVWWKAQQKRLEPENKEEIKKNAENKRLNKTFRDKISNFAAFLLEFQKNNPDFHLEDPFSLGNISKIRASFDQIEEKKRIKSI